MDQVTVWPPRCHCLCGWQVALLLAAACIPGIPAVAQQEANGTAAASAVVDAADRLTRLQPDSALATDIGALTRIRDTAPDAVLGAAIASPGMATEIARMQAYLEEASPVGRAGYEILALLGSRELSLPVAFARHAAAAAAAGVSDGLIEAIRSGAALDEFPAEYRLQVDFARQLYRTRAVRPETFAAFEAALGRRGAFDAMMALTLPALPGMFERLAALAVPGDAILPALADAGTPAGTPGEFLELGPRPPLPADVDAASTYRWPLLTRAELDAEALVILDRIAPGAAVVPRGPVGMTFNSPAFVDPVQQINTLLRVEGALDRRLSEIVITATGREMNSQYQWLVHGSEAARENAGDAVLNAIRNDGSLAGIAARDATAIRLVRELFREPVVTAATFGAALAEFGPRGTVEIAALAGDYLAITNLYNALGMRLRADQAPAMPHRVGAPIGAEWR